MEPKRMIIEIKKLRSLPGEKQLRRWEIDRSKPLTEQHYVELVKRFEGHELLTYDEMVPDNDAIRTGIGFREKPTYSDARSKENNKYIRAISSQTHVPVIFLGRRAGEEHELHLVPTRQMHEFEDLPERTHINLGNVVYAVRKKGRAIAFFRYRR